MRKRLDELEESKLSDIDFREMVIKMFKEHNYNYKRLNRHFQELSENYEELSEFTSA